MIKNNLGWICAIVILLCHPAQASAPTLCLWDMYALAAIAGFDSYQSDYTCNRACAIANEMIKRRSK